MTIIQAILAVMMEAGYPLTPKEAYQRIIDRDLYTFNAQNPLGVVKGQIRRHCLELDFPSANAKKYFRLESNGKFSPLLEPVRIGTVGRGRKPSPSRKNIVQHPRSLNSAFAEIRALQTTYRELLKERILRDLKKLSPDAFEHFAEKLLEVYGFQDIKVTSISNDGGIDGFGKLKVGLAHMRVAFQCNRWKKSNVCRPEIDRFRGAIQGDYEQGLFFTTMQFSSGAQTASIKSGAVPIILIDGPGIVDLMIEKQFGVQKEPLAIYTYALDTILAEEND
jgi:restriction system protein